ncbi:hypothetical protein CAPTEDRAFT_190519 [Capitella teleta]|uniref:C1q domain-containing protein n=1 Tax=Capitella teleta TaxID=283909 RepID=R7TH17_CAPTE|nr:hypothetical protein CAPTEDRAFT_190519 [Capitella teleta]|eukprot:ELT92999.1 hypothetical protein CAPTEDRAFT_190519 [Capitella teleta]
MKLILACAALLCVSCAYEFDCPTDVHGDCIERRYAHPDCSYYFRCYDDPSGCIAIVIPCQDDLHFSPKYQECIHPYHANCTDSTTTSTTQFTPPPVEDVSAFSAARSYDWYGGDAIVYFDQVDVNLRECFKNGTTFVPGREGVYFMSFSGGIPSRTPVHIKIRPTNWPNYPSTIYRESTTAEDINMMYRTFLAGMSDTDYLNYKSFEPMESGESLQASFAGFSLTDMFHEVKAFYVAREEPFEFNQRIPMSRIFMDIEDNYNKTGREFIAPETGIYYFFFGAGQQSGKTNRVALQTWDEEFPKTEAELWMNSDSHNGLEMASRSTILRLTAGERAWVTAVEGPVESMVDHCQVYFGGFWYNPAHATTIAFAVHRTSPWQSAMPLDPVEFHEVGVNQGNAFNHAANVVIIPKSGYYYIELSIGSMPHTTLDVEILLNGNPETPENLGERIAHVSVESTNHTGVATSGRGLITHLWQNDILRLRANGLSGIFSDLNKQTTWMGLLLYEDYY